MVSIFLLIIFVATYLFMGLLVDAGRHRMAQAYAEAALDSASESILSNYNQLVFDLYGLFSVDIQPEDGQDVQAAIEEKYMHYLEETLGLVANDTSQYQTMLSKLLFEPNYTAINAGTLYDYQLEEDSLEAGTVITLADTANVESQIIEYMKFRAPVELLDNIDGFVAKIKQITQMKDAIQASLEKASVVKQYEDGENGLAERADRLINNIASYIDKVYSYSIVGSDDGGMGANPYAEDPIRMMDWVEEFDMKLQQYLDEREEMLNKEAIAKEVIECNNRLSDAVLELQNFVKKEVKEDPTKELCLELDETEKRELSGLVDEHNAFSTANLSRENAWWVSDALNKLVREKEEDEYRNFIEVFDTELQNMINLQKRSENIEETAETAFWEKCNPLCKEFQEAFQVWNQVAFDLVSIVDNGEADSLYQEMQNLTNAYTAYISDMEQRSKENDAKKEVFEPQIQQAKAAAGAVLKHMELLLSIKEQLSAMTGLDLIDYIYDFAKNDVCKRRVHNPEDSSLTMKNQITSNSGFKESYTDASGSKLLYQTGVTESYDITNLMGKFSALQKRFCVVYSIVAASDISEYKTEEAEKKKAKKGKTKVDTDKMKEKADEKAKDTPLDTQSIIDNPDWLNVNYAYTSSAAPVENMEIGLEEGQDVDASFVESAMNVGLDLLAKLGDLLEDGRDNLYVNAYIMTMFPNYRDHYKLVEDNETEKQLSEEYKDYQASFAEVEYIITGKTGVQGESGFGEESVESMRAKLLGTRMLFNMISIYTDSGKYQQACAMCAWAGPFVTLAAIVLMAAWATAESVLDVMILMGELDGSTDKEVAVFKRGKAWFFSAEGMLSQVTDMLIDTAVEKATDGINNLVDNLHQKTDALIYDAYTAVTDNANAILADMKDKAENTIQTWGNALETNLAEVDEAGYTANYAQNLTNDVVNTLHKETKGAINEIALSSKEEATIQTARMSKAIKEKAETTITNWGEDAKQLVKDNIENLLPDAETTTSVFSSLTMSYHDYLYFFLFIMNHEVKLQRVQSVIQANLRVGGADDFSMEDAPVSVWADLKCSIKYMFMSDVIVPESMKRNGRMKLDVISAQSY